MWRVLDLIISALHSHERLAYDNGVISEWMQTETKLVDIFDGVPEIKATIKQMRKDRSRVAKERKKNNEGAAIPTLHIEHNNGPILTGNVERKIIKSAEE